MKQKRKILEYRRIYKLWTFPANPILHIFQYLIYRKHCAVFPFNILFSSPWHTFFTPLLLHNNICTLIKIIIVYTSTCTFLCTNNLLLITKYFISLWISAVSDIRECYFSVQCTRYSLYERNKILKQFYTLNTPGR